MKIVIDIPEEVFDEILRVAVRNDTPLPKGHGDLKDADDLVRFVSHYAYPIRYDCNSIEQGMSITGINQCINESPTIIEADKGGEQE